jgi:hypothetical protein
MVYNTQNYWVFELFPSSGILETRKHDVSFSLCIFLLSPAELAWSQVIK